MEAAVILLVTNKPDPEHWVNTHGNDFQILEMRNLLSKPPTDQQITLIAHWVSTEGSSRVVIVDSRKTRCNGTNDYAMAWAVAVARAVTVPVQVVWLEKGRQHRQIVDMSALAQLPLAV